ncbi:MAG: hypothetical protein A3F17_08755 [Gammaproteobacteria bacterium RIFCSPHIGHO2_12_FULL_41_15]|nr:MAG: hypothetical protein A3F17_08755 [Gammaproteobacteria bacterium RIFCSPHIGHO2_12_FULL_41_15]
MITACRYEKPIAHFISAFKFHHQLRYRQLLAEILLAKIPDHCRPDIILPIPLHKRRLQKRGFNQAVEIAKLISKTMQIPISTNEVIRTLNTQPQTALKIPERHKNIKKAFAITKPMHYTTVAILDDVITTGATVSAMANCLQQAGIKTVYVLGVARTYR